MVAGLVVLGTARGGMPVKAALTTHERYTVATTAPFSMTPAEPPVLLGIDFTLLFAGVRLAGLEVTDGVIVIDGDHNADAFATLAGQLPGAFVLARDADLDGVIDETELLPR